jgi:hypothetical protein
MFTKSDTPYIAKYGIVFRLETISSFSTRLVLVSTIHQFRTLYCFVNVEGYSQGPLDEKMCGLLPMWVFGKQVKKREVYIKVSMGNESTQAVCISFHIAERPMSYPFKKQTP